MPHFRLRVPKVTTTTARRNHLAKVRGENSQSRATFGEDQGQPENSKDKEKSCGFSCCQCCLQYLLGHVFFVGWSDSLGCSKRWRNDCNRRIHGITESYWFLVCEYMFFCCTKFRLTTWGCFFSVFVFFK